ncbi:hypothetical protein ACFSTC_31765 [Nonomuraea ferruginea]
MGSFSTIQISRESVFTVPGGRALDLTNAELRSRLLIEEGATVEGTLRLARRPHPGRPHVAGHPLEPPGGDLRHLRPGRRDRRHGQHAGGEDRGRPLGFRAATVGGVVNVRNARLHNPGGQALSSNRPSSGARSCSAPASPRTARSCSTGAPRKAGSTATTAPSPLGIKAVSATTREGMRLRWAEVPPHVDLTGAATTVLADDVTRWPSDTAISGFVYDRFDDAWDWRQRRDWLRSMTSYDASPYEQAARVFRQHGRPVEAEHLLMELRRRAPRRGWIRDTIDALYGLTVGYGYRPGRVLWLLGALLVLVYAMLLTPVVQETLRATDPRGNVYAADGRLVTVEAATPEDDSTVTVSRRDPRPGPCGDGQVRCFDPLFYTVDTVVPLLSLGQRATWYPETRTGGGSLVSGLLNVAQPAGMAAVHGGRALLRQAGQAGVTIDTTGAVGGSPAHGAGAVTQARARLSASMRRAQIRRDSGASAANVSEAW